MEKELEQRESLSIDTSSFSPIPPVEQNHGCVEIEQKDIRIIQTLGRGAYGVVQKAEWRGQIVAVKTIHTATEKSSFIKELTQLSRVSHHNIVKLYAACTRAPVFFAMEFCECGSLYNFLHRSKPLTPYSLAHALSWVYQCARAVEYLHGMKPQPIVHRDLKPPNMLLVDFGRVLKICDFGTACQLQTYMTNNQGSAAWMAPEVFEGRRYSEKCDVFSWGIILWEVLTRRRPFDEIGINAFRIMWAVHAGKRPPLIQNCPKAIELLMTQCWKKEPTERPSMSDIAGRMQYFMRFVRGADVPLVFPQETDTSADDAGVVFEDVFDDMYSDQRQPWEEQHLLYDGGGSTLVNDSYVAPGPNDEGEPVIVQKFVYPTPPNIVEDTRESLGSVPPSLRSSVESVKHTKATLQTQQRDGVGARRSSMSNISKTLAVVAPMDEGAPSVSAMTSTVQDAGAKKGHRRGGSYDTAFLHSTASSASVSNVVAPAPPPQPLSQGRERLRLTLPPRHDGSTPTSDEAMSLDDSASNIPMLYALLENHLHPIPPCTSSKESMAIFRDHCRLAEEYVKVAEEIRILVPRKQELIGLLDQDMHEQNQSDRLSEEFEQLQQEKEKLLSLHASLKTKVEKVRKHCRYET